MILLYGLYEHEENGISISPNQAERRANNHKQANVINYLLM
jgi:hypothetical protein